MFFCIVLPRRDWNNNFIIRFYSNYSYPFLDDIKRQMRRLLLMNSSREKKLKYMLVKFKIIAQN